MVERPGSESTSEPDPLGTAVLSLEGLCVATLWTTGPDTTADAPVKLAAMRRTPAGDWEFFEELCRAPSDAPEALREHAEGVRRDFGLDLASWEEARPLAEVWPEFEAFLGEAPVLVPDGALFESWFEHLAGEDGDCPLTLGLDELARLFAPGPLAARGIGLVHDLLPDTQAPSPHAVAPPEVWFAFHQLAARPRSLPRLAREVVRVGYGKAAQALVEKDARAAARLALALALCSHPEHWAPEPGPASLPSADAVARELRDPLDDLQPEWTRRARQWGAAPSLPPRLEDPTPFPDEDTKLLDALFETHLPALFEQGTNGTGASAYRASQHQAATEIARTLGREELLAVHAPTGTGKTLAYLIPALLWARRHGVRVGVATYTRALQSQAMEHEVPRALRALASAGVKEGFRVSILKGRNNYLCWRAMCSWTPEATDSGEAWLAWTHLVVFSQIDGEGDLDRLARRPPVRLADTRQYQNQIHEGLRRAAAQSGCCTHRDDRATCGAECARRRAERSHVVLTNHSFALARQEFFKHVIFDECEHLHEVAHNAWSHSLSLAKARELLEHLGDTGSGAGRGATGRRGKKRGRRKRRTPRTPLERLGRELVAGTPFFDLLERTKGELRFTATALDDLAQEVAELEEWRDRARRKRGEREIHTLLRDYMGLPEALPLIDARNRLAAGCADLDASLSGLAEQLDAKPMRASRSVRRSLDLARADLTDLSNQVQAWLPLKEGRPAYRPETFYDVETDIRGQRALVARVLLPAEYLGRNYYPGLKSAVFLSATTWLQDGFDSALAYLGLDRAAHPDPDEQRDGCTVRTFRAPEVFDYGRVLVLVPRDAPSVARRKDDFLRYVRDFIGWLGERTRGRMLVLFTNAQDTRATGRALEGFFRTRRIPLLYQGMPGAEKEELAERFRNRVDSILLGVDTFWYGADFPGETLEYLVLVKLPYGVPDLYHHAQCSALGLSEQRRRIYQPRALAKFRQGFGRLLRTTEDRGCVFILDDRILDPRHRSFLRELPLLGPGRFEKNSGVTTAQLARGDTDLCARRAFEHMGIQESVARRGLHATFAETFGAGSSHHGEADLLRPFAHDQPPPKAERPRPESPWQTPPAKADVPIDELPF